MGCSDSNVGLVACLFLFTFCSFSFIQFNKHNTTTEHRSISTHNGHNYTDIHVLSVHT